MELNSGTLTVLVDYEKAAALSSSLLSYMDADDITVGEGVAALSIALGRLLHPDSPTDEEMFEFSHALLEWGGAYWAEGMN